MSFSWINHLMFVLCISWSSQILALKPMFGTYAGVVENQLTGKNQLVKLELIPSRVENGNMILRGVLTLQMGGFDSGEYVSYHFHDITFNLLTGALTFYKTEQEVYVMSASIKEGELTGELFYSLGRIGPLRMSSGKATLPTHALVEPLNGEYRGKCDGIASSLHLYTFRSTADVYRPGNAFAAYAVKGQLGKYDYNYCGKESYKYCVHSKIESASYNYIIGALVLRGLPFSYTCTVSGSKIDCGECSFDRISSEMQHPQLAPNIYESNPIEKIKSSLKTKSVESLAGSYHGYVFHEQLNAFQRIQIDVSTYQKPDVSGSKLFVVVVAKLRFGDASMETLPYRYDPIEFPNPVIAPQFVLAQPDADVDAVIRITNIRDGIIEGTWNSLIFGRVGPFVATVNGDLPVLNRSEVLDSLSGFYDESEKSGDSNGDNVIVDLVVSLGSSPVGSDNPFYPLNLYGNVWWKSGIIEKQEIIGGSYDFYTGKIAFQYGKDRLLSGFIGPNKSPKFRRLGGGYGTLMQDYAPAEYKKRHK